MRTVFAGSTLQAAECLKELIATQDVRLVLTRPDARRGRGRKESANPVRQAAKELEIECFDANPSDPAFAEKLKEKEVECGAVVAYGRLISPRLLSLLPKGWYNLHFSLLPYFRGANPVAACVLEKYAHCGVTVFKLTEEETTRLLRMEDELHKRVVGQNDAVSADYLEMPEEIKL